MYSKCKYGLNRILSIRSNLLLIVSSTVLWYFIHIHVQQKWYANKAGIIGTTYLAKLASDSIVCYFSEVVSFYIEMKVWRKNPVSRAIHMCIIFVY